MNWTTSQATEFRIRTLTEHLSHARPALSHLLHSLEYARDVQCDAWEFALDIECLKRDGLREADLRWLLMKRLIQHAREYTRQTDRTRRFGPLQGTMFSNCSCFLLTEQGAKALAAMLKTAPLKAVDASTPATDRKTNPAPMPIWDRDRRELLCLSRIVKRFRVAAPNQEIVLAAFQEDCWPPRIDDPLPPVGDTVSKRRLHDTIVSLNRNRKAKIIRFLGDGSGEGIRWELEAALTPRAAGV